MTMAKMWERTVPESSVKSIITLLPPKETDPHTGDTVMVECIPMFSFN